jgi:chromate reductase, NAD(P)H dehydrogenase (quinone)
MISGSLRSGSTNTAVLRTAEAVAPPGMLLTRYRGVSELPHFNPDDDGPPVGAEVEELRASIRAADAVLLSTPEYAGDLPGSFKNVLDWAVGDHRSGSMYGKPVAWINCSPRGAPGAHAALRTVLGYLGAQIVDEACIDVPVERAAVGTDGLVASEAVRGPLADALSRLDERLPRRPTRPVGRAPDPHVRRGAPRGTRTTQPPD